MEPFEIELKNALNRTHPIPASELAALNERIVQTYARKQKGFSRLLGVYLAVMILGILVLWTLFMTTSNLKQCLFYGILILIFYEATVLMKLWFWIMHGKVTTMREIKLLQLAVAELKTRPAPEPPRTAPSFPDERPPAPAPTPTAAPSRKLWLKILFPLWLAAVASFVYLTWLQNPHEPRNVTPYFEKTFAAADGTAEWQQDFEVTQARQHFYPRVVPAGRSARVWISVSAEGKKPMYDGAVEPGSRMSFGKPAPGRYVIKGRTEMADGSFTVRLGGVDEIPGTPSFGRLFLLLLSTALAVVIPLLWLQDRWVRRIDPELS